MNKKQQIIILVIAALVVAGGSFYGGMVYKGSQTPQRSASQRSNAGNRFVAGSNFISGDVIAKDSQSITIKDRTGSSRIVFYSDSTQVGEFVPGKVADLAMGQTVMVNGKTNTDGSVTAQSIQIRPVNPQGN